MKILIELPTWLGDAIMATPAIENIATSFNDLEITLLGSIVSTEALKNHPKVTKSYVLDKNYFTLYDSLIGFGKFDIFLSFRSSFRSKILKSWVKANKKYQFDKTKFIKGHQVEKYNDFINTIIKVDTKPGKLILHPQKTIQKSKKKFLGINPGASYGSAKRWHPEKYADVAVSLSKYYEIIIFGGADEKEIASDIEKRLIKYGITNYENLSNKTSIVELISKIKKLDLFITGDSGPMHIAAAYKIPTISIFGPTNDAKTSQWMNDNSVILKSDLDCQPCMKRSCPLGHHKCMKLIEASDVIEAVNSI